MSRLTTDPGDPDLGRGVDYPEKGPVPQNKAYLVLSPEELAKGFVRPLRKSYVHVGIAGPKFPLEDITEEQKGWWWTDGKPGPNAFIKFERYPEGYESRPGSKATGRYWSQEQLDSVGKGCGTLTSMSYELAATYAREPSFYGATYCCGCSRHLPVGKDGEFVWADTDERVGT